jgi:hypothetical protein
VAIELLFSGWSTIFVALAARKAAQHEAAAARTVAAQTK